jgi:hypothetical protein
METGIHFGVLVPMVAVIALAYVAGFYIQATAIPVAPPGPPMDSAPEDCKAACQQWQAAQLARALADNAVRTAKAIADKATAAKDTAFWAQLTALALYLSAILNPGMAGFASDFFVLYMLAMAYYIYCIGAQKAALKDYEDKVQAARDAYINENQARWTVITTCTGEQADDCLAHPQPA